MKFSTHAVAYLDILGFSKFVEDAENDLVKLNSLDKLFSEVIPREISAEGINSQYPADLGLKCLSCSDSMVVSAPTSDQSSYPALIAVSIKAIQIAHALLDMGFLVRGAIAVGNVHRTDSNILGTGYQEAVNGEKHAGNPQIVLTESAKKALDELIEKGMPRHGIFAKNELGWIILDSIYPHQNYLPDKEGNVDTYFRKYRDTILKNLSHDDPRAKEKWLWFSGLFNANVKYFSTHFAMIKDGSIAIDQELLSVTMNYLNPPEENSNWMDRHMAPGVRVTLK